MKDRNSYNPYLNTYYEDLIKRQSSTVQRIPVASSSPIHKSKTKVKSNYKKRGVKHG